MVQQPVDNGYCVLPFNHLNIHPNGQTSVCCVSKMVDLDSGFSKEGPETFNRLMNLKTDSVDSMFNSYSTQNIRDRMQAGEYPSTCEGCYKIEQHGGKSRRIMENQRWGHRDTPGLEFIDLRLSNLCNLKCMMCYPDSSSALVTDYTEWQKELPFMSTNAATFELFQWFNEDVIEQLEEHKNTLKYLYINGGEPFIMPMQWKLLQRLIDWGVAENIQISYNTNCTTYNESFSDYWKHFKVVTLGCSVDAVDERNKFIRYPANWETTNTNLRKLIANEHIDATNITCSIQWLNAPYLDEFYDWALNVIGDRAVTINQNFVVFPEYLSLNCASREFKDNLLKLYEGSKHRDRILTDTMMSYLRTDSEDDKLWNQGMQYLDVVSKTRKMGPWRDIFNYDYRY